MQSTHCKCAMMLPQMNKKTGLFADEWRCQWSWDLSEYTGKKITLFCFFKNTVSSFESLTTSTELKPLNWFGSMAVTAITSSLMCKSKAKTIPPNKLWKVKKSICEMCDCAYICMNNHRCCLLTEGMCVNYDVYLEMYHLEWYLHRGIFKCTFSLLTLIVILSLIIYFCRKPVIFVMCEIYIYI